MTVNILCVGKAHDSRLVESISEYEKRLSGFGVKIHWQIIPSQDRPETAMQKHAESQGLLKIIGKDDFVILLDENGRQIDNQQLAQQLTELRDHSRTVTFIIGGAFGVDDALHQRAQMVLSLSKLVFPHQLVRLILSEQIYRTFAIINGRKYHH